jgi:hypothetical protein
MHALTHERRDGSIDQPVARELRLALERIGDDHDAEMASFARPGMAGVPGAVIDDLERAGHQLPLDRFPKLLNPG